MRKEMSVGTYAKIFFLLFSLSTCAYAQDKSDSLKKSDPPPQNGIVGSPFIDYKPETKFAIGVVGLYYFHLWNDSAKGNIDTSKNRPSSVSFGITYTQRRQFSTGTDYTLYFSHDNDYIFGGLDYKKIPFDFYGIGHHTPKNPIDNYTPLWRGGDILFTRNLLRTSDGEGLSAGIGTEYRYDLILSSDSGGLIQTGNVPGSKGGLSGGWGVIVDYDTRDNVFSSHDGLYMDFRTMVYSKYVGGSFNFTRVSLDTRDFIPAFSTHTIALQGLITLVGGIEPFYTMAGLGGEAIMRGIAEGRYRDNDMAVLQGEYRMPLVWRFGLVVFAGIGEVAGVVNEFNLSSIKWNAGAGIRFIVSETEHVVVRLDFGFGNDSSELYLFVNEAF
jgi:outer membrane protein assembly factor BamA